MLTNALLMLADTAPEFAGYERLTLLGALVAAVVALTWTVRALYAQKHEALLAAIAREEKIRHEMTECAEKQAAAHEHVAVSLSRVAVAIERAPCGQRETERRRATPDPDNGGGTQP